MATRKPKKTDDHFIKSINPRDPDTKYMGEEPFFPAQPAPEYRGVALARSFAWYNRFCSKKDAKELLAQYLEHNQRLLESKTFRKVDEKELLTTFAWLARMTLRGLELTEHEELSLQNEITRLLKSTNKPTVVGEEVEVEVPVSNRPNVQEIMKEKARDAAGELEGVFDDYVTTGKVTTKTVDIVAKFNVMPQHISLIVDIWKKKQEEFEQVQEGSDKDLKEAYAHIGKVQLRNIVKFIEQVLGDLNSYVSIKKASKAPRARKAVPVEKIVAKLKYQKEFKDATLKLDLISVHPTKLHGASEAWVYDTAKRKLHHFVADEYSKTFTVKGNTILGFDNNKSEVKTLRKPGEQLKEIMGSKPAARKFFADIKAVATTPNGRFNCNMIILKAF
jgi:hypothetical protein